MLIIQSDTEKDIFNGCLKLQKEQGLYNAPTTHFLASLFPGLTLFWVCDSGEITQLLRASVSQRN